ncbi:unnamed protein product [Amoebophrya sp. A25]|nr:unnamed protein product [Amoebophrya sp. A25]|eukprot:GSA25T00002614001.1
MLIFRLHDLFVVPRTTLTTSEDFSDHTPKLRLSYYFALGPELSRTALLPTVGTASSGYLDQEHEQAENEDAPRCLLRCRIFLMLLWAL